MKKIVFASAALVSVLGAMDASATAVCSNATAAAAGATVAVGGFVKQTFTPKCSANTFVDGIDGTAYYAVGSASSKGKTSFKGSTSGGGVAAHTTCTTAGACVVGDATTASAAAPTT